MEATQTPSIEFTTTRGTRVTLKEFITGRESRVLEAAYLDMPDDMKQSEKINHVNDELIRMVVLSVNGTTDNLLDQVLNMCNEDTYEILGKIKEITSNKKKPASTPEI